MIDMQWLSTKVLSGNTINLKKIYRNAQLKRPWRARNHLGQASFGIQSPGRGSAMLRPATRVSKSLHAVREYLLGQTLNRCLYYPLLSGQVQHSWLMYWTCIEGFADTACECRQSPEARFNFVFFAPILRTLAAGGND